MIMVSSNEILYAAPSATALDSTCFKQIPATFPVHYLASCQPHTGCRIKLGLHGREVRVNTIASHYNNCMHIFELVWEVLSHTFFPMLVKFTQYQLILNLLCIYMSLASHCFTTTGPLYSLKQYRRGSYATVQQPNNMLKQKFEFTVYWKLIMSGSALDFPQTSYNPFTNLDKNIFSRTLLCLPPQPQCQTVHVINLADIQKNTISPPSTPFRMKIRLAQCIQLANNKRAL